MVSIDELFYGTGVSGLTEIERLQKKYNDFADNVSVFKAGMSPLFMPVPSWWQGNFTQKGWTPAWQIPHMHSGNPYTNDEALQYLDIAEKAYQLKLDWRSAQCENENQRGVYCSYVNDIQGTLGKIRALKNGVRIAKEQNLQHGVTGFDPNFKTFEILPQVFAEEDPSINSGLNGSDQESQVIDYPQSANVRISFTSNIGMFSTSIPINDISQLQILSNASNEWNYTLIGSSTNQPLMSLSGLIAKINSMIASVIVDPGIKPPIQDDSFLDDYPIEEEPITTDHVIPPEVEPEVPMVTATEPGQINWIPEPFFSFINNVFRK